MRTRQNYRSLVVRNLAFRLGVYPNQIEVLPDFSHKLVEVPLVFGADRHIVGNLVKQVQLLNRNGVDLV